MKAIEIDDLLRILRRAKKIFGPTIIKTGSDGDLDLFDPDFHLLGRIDIGTERLTILDPPTDPDEDDLIQTLNP